MLVVDTSAVVEALAGRSPAPALIERLVTDGDLHAPHLIDVELLHVLRRLVGAGHLASDRAEDARSDFAELRITRYGHEPLADRMWQLRDNLTAYDAAFISLAESLGVPLMTCDARLAGAPGTHAVIEVFAAGARGGG